MRTNRRRASFACFLAALLLSSAVSCLAHEPWTWKPNEKAFIDRQERTVRQEDGFFVLDGPKWNVRTEVSARFTAELSAFMELYDLAFHQIMNMKLKAATDRKPAVVVYAAESTYAKRFPDGSRGHYAYHYDDDGKFTEFDLYSYVANEKEKTFANFYYPILQHEGTHLLLRKYLGRAPAPVWFDEGAATYFQFWDLRATVARNFETRYGSSAYRPVLRRWMEANKNAPPALDGLLKLTAETWNPDKMGPEAQMHYALAENFSEFLFSTKEGQAYFGTVFKRILAREEPVSGEERARIEPAWHRHLRRSIK